MCELLFMLLPTFFYHNFIVIYDRMECLYCVCVSVRVRACVFAYVSVIADSLNVYVCECVYRCGSMRSYWIPLLHNTHIIFTLKMLILDACNIKLNGITPTACCRLFARMLRIKCKCLWWNCTHKSWLCLCAFCTYILILTCTNTYIVISCLAVCMCVMCVCAVKYFMWSQSREFITLYINGHGPNVKISIIYQPPI